MKVAELVNTPLNSGYQFDEYHKINSIQKRYADGPNKGKFTGEWTHDHYRDLAHTPWVCREKIDGTNIRVNLWIDQNGRSIAVDGRTNRANIPDVLAKRMLSICEDNFNFDWTTVFDEKYLYEGITIFGEGFGGSIQKGSNYGAVDFIVFDIKVGGLWLNEDAVTSIADALGLRRVPIYPYINSLYDAIDAVSSRKLASHFDGYGEAEGIVAVPASGILDRRGNRIIAKVKGVDFPLNDIHICKTCGQGSR